MNNPSLVGQLKTLLRDPVKFVDSLGGVHLRQYQVEVVRAAVESVVGHQGRSIVVIFPRQSGKNEVQAQIETYLLCLLSQLDAEMVKVSPTWKPQSLNAMRRLDRVMTQNQRGQAVVENVAVDRNFHHCILFWWPILPTGRPVQYADKTPPLSWRSRQWPRSILCECRD